MNQKNPATTSQYLHGRSPVEILSNGDGGGGGADSAASDKLAGSDQHKILIPRHQ